MRKNVVTMNPAKDIEMPEAETAAPVIMPVSDVQIYLTTVEAGYPELLPREAIAFFCGLRPEELTRLDWQNLSIENKSITIGKDVAKMAKRRIVDVPDCLIKWLAPFARADGRVSPYTSQSALYKARRAARKAAGVEVPDNAGRHAFASYHLAMHSNAPLTSEALGHADTDLLKNTYRNIVANDGKSITKTAATAYFSIMPKRDAGIIQLRAAG